ncbi:Fe-S-containing hydro-lyase [bacterium]|nr:Fe-S-containing hydro-lyase [bacterium]
MNNVLRIETPLDEETISKLKIGERVLLSGLVYTARDQAHKRLLDELESARRENRQLNLPFPLEGQVIYYVGPAPARPGMVIGPAGPTTSCRMDPYTPVLLEKGLKGTIGKGRRGKDVIEAMKKYKAIYFVAVGGAAVLISKKIKRVETVAYEDLGPEAIYRLDVEDFPLIVANDVYGNDLFDEGMKRYQKLAIRENENVKNDV